MKLGIMISGGVYFLLFVLSLILNSKIDSEFISKWGLGLGIFILISLLPLNRLLFFASRPIAPNWVPPDEHLYQRITRAYEVEKDKEENPYKWVQVATGIITISLSVFMILIR